MDFSKSSLEKIVRDKLSHMNIIANNEEIERTVNVAMENNYFKELRTITDPIDTNLIFDKFDSFMLKEKLISLVEFLDALIVQVSTPIQICMAINHISKFSIFMGIIPEAKYRIADQQLTSISLKDFITSETTEFLITQCKYLYGTQYYSFARSARLSASARIISIDKLNNAIFAAHEACAKSVIFILGNSACDDYKKSITNYFSTELKNCLK